MFGSTGGGLFGSAPPAAGAGGGLFGSAAATTGIGGGGLGGANPQAEAQLLCMELQKRMEDIFPILQRAGGDRQAAAQAAVAGAARAGELQQSFVGYTYSFCGNPQQLVQSNAAGFQIQQHIDPAKWMQAMQNNPDPQSCYPEAMVGLSALEQRLQSQQKAVEETTAALEELRGGFSNLKDHLQAQSQQKLEECRQRQQRLQRQLLQVVIALERRALSAGAACRNPAAEVELEARLARLEEACSSAGGARARLEELWAQLRQLLQQGPPPGGPAQLPQLLSTASSSSTSGAQGSTAVVQASGADRFTLTTGATGPSSDSGGDAAEQALRVTARQGELLEALADELARRRRDVTQFEGALARFSAQGPPPNGFSPYG
eukprot:TRINITY_DN21314_c0_g2_i1.p1 TRINITY_DN21314_c0_g2~~TRINITY_DN21314_c0_g2_i1.p1  ORF type:complete len:376 (-),score=127.77 TRINITY_DN21314_c0_g2_i1:215-1342(-)